MGCVNPAQSYVAKHPELSAEHRQILLAGKIRDGTSVAGMTKLQVRLAMKTDPDQFTTFNGMEAWVYFKGGGGAAPETGHHHGGHTGSPTQPDDSPSAGGYSSTRGGPVSNLDSPIGSGDSSVAAEKKGARTTILFVGDHAVRADVSRE